MIAVCAASDFRFSLRPSRLFFATFAVKRFLCVGCPKPMVRDLTPDI